jgi:hypothetical protein
MIQNPESVLSLSIMLLGVVLALTLIGLVGYTAFFRGH